MSSQTKRTPDTTGNVPLAIVGLSCMFPQAPDKQSFWRVLRRGENCITEVPSTHWSVADLYDGDSSSPDRTYAKVGGFLAPYDFDPSEFSMPPNVLEATDTSQLLALVGAKEALRDAGYGDEEGLKDIPKEKTSVILGVTGCLELVIPLGARLGHPRWRKALHDAGIDDETSQKIIAQISDSYVGWQENSFPGLLGNVVAGRIANKLDLHGTNCVVDAACASSLAALHLGIMELQSGNADMVISGGVDTFNDIFMYECFSKTPALSHNNQIRPFSEDSDGTLLGEGVGVVILKRLADAEAAGDKIYAVIKGIGSSSDGRSGAIYAPDSVGQRRSVERAYEYSGINPATLDIIEAHGTGTKKGDIVEFEGLQSYFGALKEDKQWCALGTVKSQIGHTKAAAGSASLCKMALALYNKVLLPTINVTKPHPNLHIDDSAFYLNNVARPWLGHPDHPRRAALSSFGFGGSNFHVVLEEYSTKRIAPAWDGSVLIFAYSASSCEELIATIQEHTGKLSKNVAYQAKQSCAKFDSKAPWKATAVCSAVQAPTQLQALASALQEGKPLPTGCFASDGTNSEHKVAFLFPGQGSQYLHMGSELAAIFPEVLESFQTAEKIVPEEQRPYAKIFPLPSYDEETTNAQNAALTATQATQVALGTLESSQAAILRRFGVEPQAVAGHSYGELVALHTAGRLTSAELFSLSALRGRLMAAGDGGRGGMLAVSASEDIAEQVAKEVGHLSVANRNHPKQFVLTGLKESIQQAQTLLKERKVTARPLQVSAAFHSELMASAVEPFGQALQEAAFPASDIPVYANLTGDIYPEDAEESRQTLAKQLVNAVNFITIIENMYAKGFDIFVEVGPKAVLGGLVKNIMDGRPYHMMATDSRKGGGELLQLAQTLAELACLGLPVRLDEWEEKHPQPAVQKFSVSICGANYRKPGSHSPAPWAEPKQPADNYVKLTPIVKPVAPKPQATPPVAKPAASEPKVSVPAPKPLANKPQVSAPNPTLASSKMNSTNQNDYPSVPVTDASAHDALRIVQEGIMALQNLQQQTAYAHQKFLENQTRIQCALQTMLMANQQYMMHYGLTMPYMMPQPPLMPPMPGMPFMPPTPMHPMPPMAMMPLPQTAMSHMQQLPPLPQLPPMAQLAPMPHTPSPLTSQPLASTPMSVSSPVAVESASAPENPSTQMMAPAVAPIAPAVKAPQPKPLPTVIPAAIAPTVSASSLESTMLAIVAEKTGYPTEMITLDMDMEADLGIDSIKRVEILAVLEEKMPGVKTITPDEIGQLHTLKQVLNRLSGSNASAATVPSPAEVAKPVATAAPAGNVTEKLMAVVAEKTGYPQEMINLDMDMEADLGIDSIKRVEILAAIEESIPGVNSITPDEIGSLHTLKQVIERLGNNDTVVAPEATNAPAPVSSADDAAFENIVLQVVAEKTGYPTESLTLDNDIENDLGIDSIKRVEILAAIEEKIPGINSITPDEIGNLHTLRQIVERIRPFDPTTPPTGGPSGPTHGGGSKSQATSFTSSADAVSTITSLSEATLATAKAPSTAAETVVPALQGPMPLPPIGKLERRILRYRESAAPAPTGLPGGSGPYLLLDDGYLAPEVKTIMEERGAMVYLAKPSQLARFSPHFGEEISLSERDSQLKEILPSLRGLIAFMPRSSNEGWDDSYCAIIKDHFLTLQAVAPGLSKQRSLYATVSRLDGCMGQSGECFNPLEGGLHSVGKVIAQEWPDTVCRAIDIDPNWDAHEAAVALVNELCCPGAMEVGLRPNSRVIPELSSATFVPHHNRAWEAGQVIVVSGGARGVTADCVKTMASHLHPTFVLLGRSPVPSAEDPELATAKSAPELKNLLFKQAKERGEKLTPAQLEKAVRSILANREINATLAELRAQGCQAEYISVDVRDRQAVADILDAVRSRYGAIHGLIHAAGVLADRKIVDKTRTQFDSVFDTKIYGLINLLNATRQDDLRFIALFSSVTARFGRPGQSDYAIANEVMNKAARLEATLRPLTHVVSIGWGPWDGGMVDDSLRREFAKIGAQVIPRPDGALALTDEIVYGPSRDNEVIMGTGFSLQREDDLGVRTYQFPCSIEDMPILNDHAFGGQPILPMAFMMEYFAQAACKRYPRLHFKGVDSLQVQKPLPVGKDQVATVTCSAAIVSGQDLRVPIQLQNQGITYATASVVLSPHLDLNDYVALPEFPQENVPFSVMDVYERFLFHGLSFQCIASLDSASDTTLAVTADGAPQPSQWWHKDAPRCWISEPMLADCALQLGLIWSGWRQECPSLPLSALRYRQYTDSFPEQVRLLFTMTERKGMLFRGDVLFCDNERVIAEWKGVRWMMDSQLKEQF